MKKKAAYQGIEGSYSHSASRTVFPECDHEPVLTFEEVFVAVDAGRADFGVVPIDNLLHGRVLDVNRLLPKYAIFVSKEHLLPIDHCLLARRGETLQDIEQVMSHPQALGQCGGFIAQHRLETIPAANTALAARALAQSRQPSTAVIASREAAEIYDLDIIAEHIQDHPVNKTRFFALQKTLPDFADYKTPVTMITFVVKSIPAALFKALGGFATNALNLTKIESFISESDFSQSSFIVEVEAHPEDDRLKQALSELAYFTETMRVAGVFDRAR